MLLLVRKEPPGAQYFSHCGQEKHLAGDDGGRFLQWLDTPLPTSHECARDRVRKHLLVGQTRARPSQTLDPSCQVV